MRILGMISGTSVDGIDCALVDINETDQQITLDLVAGKTFDYPIGLRAEVLSVADGKPLSLQDLAELDDRVAHVFADCALKLIDGHSEVNWIASHGQTVFHRIPQNDLGYSIQLARGATLAQHTRIPTVSNFRQADIIAGGQGAPMVSMLDWLMLTDPIGHRAIQNIGGISNVTFLPAGGNQSEVIGFDNGPGNVLLDRGAQQLLNIPYDDQGKIASQGRIDHSLWESWLGHSFFATPPPKSTGRELFNQQFFTDCWNRATDRGLSIADFLATLTEFTVQGILQSYQQFLPYFPNEIIVCGGGSRNTYLLQRLQHQVTIPVTTTDSYDLPSDYKEAIAFALLGYLRIHNRSGNLTSVTGAKYDTPLGEIYLPQ